MSFELVFTNRYTGSVTFAINDVALVRYITPSEVGFVDTTGRIRSSSFTQVENVSLERIPR